jgi:hypothetical protein
MSQNDLVFLEANFKNWKESRGVDLRKGLDPFVYYAIEQFLKPYDLSDEDIAYGITDGPNDGGVDAAYFIVNRSTFVRDDTTLDPRNVSKVKLILFQVKSGNEGFRQIEVDKLFFFTDDLLDMSRPVAGMTAKYHSHLLQITSTFKNSYLHNWSNCELAEILKSAGSAAHAGRNPYYAALAYRNVASYNQQPIAPGQLTEVGRVVVSGPDGDGEGDPGPQPGYYPRYCRHCSRAER